MAKKIRLDFSKVEERSGYNSRQMPEGLYKAKVRSLEQKEAGDGTPMLVYGLAPTQQKYSTRNFPYYCKLQQNQLWKLRDLFVAAGETVPKKAIQIDPEKIIGAEVVIEVTDGTGQYTDRSEVASVYPMTALEDIEEEADEEEYEEDIEEEEDFDDDEDLDEDDEDDEEYEEDEDDLDEDLDDDEELDDEDLYDDEDDEEEEEPEPAPKRAPKRSSAKKTTVKKAPAKRVVKRR